MGQFLPVNQLVGTTINHRQGSQNPATVCWWFRRQGASIQNRPGGILVNGKQRCCASAPTRQVGCEPVSGRSLSDSASRWLCISAGCLALAPGPCSLATVRT